MCERETSLICDRIIPNYTKWIWHGELQDMPTVFRTVPVDQDIGDCIEDMICDLGHECFQQAHAPLYKKIESDSMKSLYEGYTSFTRLSAVLALVSLKARFWWSDKIFTEFLVLLKKMLPKDNTLPKNQYEAKKILSCGNGIPKKSMHALMIAHCTKISL